MAILIINSDIISNDSNVLYDWMDQKKIELFELTESLKNIEFFKAHSKVNNDLNSFEFPNSDFLKKRPQKELKEELR